MAEALINHFLGEDWEAFSAGVKPSSVNPRAIQVMAEIGIDISNARSKSVDEFINRKLDLVITVCDQAKESCPVFIRPVRQLHIGFTDPSPFTDEQDDVALPLFRMVRDDIKQRLLPLLSEQACG
jgi:arsenate reductase